MDENYRYYIVYPKNSLTKLTILESYPDADDLYTNYSHASRHCFSERKKAVAYAKELAEKHGKVFVPSDPEDYYLD